MGLVGGYLIAASLYVVLTSMVLASGHWHLSIRDAMLPRINDVVVFTFFAVCGGSVGSFLNVVVWRMPQGLSVNGHSFCPRCRNSLRARDNVPVLGWLWLGGRCRDCRLPISSRYPIVEAAVAVTFALVGTLELYGWNLPYRPNPFRDAMSTPRISLQSTIPVFYHLVGLAIAWAMGLIRYDRNPIPMRLVIFASVWLIGGLVFIPSLAIVPWQMKMPAGWGSSFDPYSRLTLRETISQNFGDAEALVQATVRVATALVAAGFFARVLARAFCPDADLKTDPLSGQTRRLLDLVAMISVVALIVGWQSTSGVLLLASVLACFARTWLRGGSLSANPGEATGTDALGRFSLMIPVSLGLQILFWRPLMESGYWPSAPSIVGDLRRGTPLSNDVVGSPDGMADGLVGGALGMSPSRVTILAFAFATLFVPLWLREKPKAEKTEFTDADESEDEDAEISSDVPILNESSTDEVN